MIGKSSVESIQSGMIYGFSGAGRRARRPVRRRARRRARSSRPGGLAEPIIPHSRTVQHYEPWLTLFGLRIIFETEPVMRRTRFAARGSPRSTRSAPAGTIRIRSASTARTRSREVRDEWDDAVDAGDVDRRRRARRGPRAAEARGRASSSFANVRDGTRRAAAVREPGRARRRASSTASATTSTAATGSASRARS